MDAVTRALRTLGLGPGATQDEIARCYKDLVRVWHPDRLGGDPGLQERAQEKLKEINHAYQVLEREYTGPGASRRGSAEPARGGGHAPGTPRPDVRATPASPSSTTTTNVFVVSGPGCLWVVAGLGLLFFMARRHFLPGVAVVILLFVLSRLGSLLRRP